MNATSYVIRRKGTLDYFAGFGADGQTLFGEEDRAHTFNDRTMANAQALLLRADDESVQLKPVVTA